MSVKRKSVREREREGGRERGREGERERERKREREGGREGGREGKGKREHTWYTETLEISHQGETIPGVKTRCKLAGINFPLTLCTWKRKEHNVIPQTLKNTGE